jgi:hypothetical protein
VDAVLGQTNLCLQLSPWVGRGGGRRQSTEQSCRFVECVGGGLVVDLGGGSAAPSSISGVCLVVNFVWVSSLCVG